MSDLSVCAVIVCYFPDVAALENLVSALNVQGVTAVISSNGFRNGDFPVKGDFIMIDNHGNLGIAEAQNRGISEAIRQGAEYIIFFDQDSTIRDDFVQKLMHDFFACEKIAKKRIGTIGPRFRDGRYGFYYKVVSVDANGFRRKIDTEKIEKPLETSLIISSGSMIPVSVLEDVGMMDSSLFIDYVDTEWCFRASSKGYAVYVSSQAEMSHAIGDGMIKLWGFNVPVHSAFRRYYRVRNAFYLLGMQHVPKMVAFREILFNTIHQVVLILAVKNKKEYVGSYLCGVRDGVRHLFEKSQILH